MANCSGYLKANRRHAAHTHINNNNHNSPQKPNNQKHTNQSCDTNNTSLFFSHHPLCPLPSILSSPSPQIICCSSSPIPPSCCLSPLPYLSICLILARPLTHKSNTGHLNTICLLPMESRMGWREQRGGSMAPLTVSPLTRFHIHLPIASSLPPSPSLFSCFVPNPVLTQLHHTHLQIL